MTGRDVYRKALAIINERDSEGDFHTDTYDYEKNAHELINLLVAKLWCDDCIVKGLSPKDWRYAVEEVTSLDEQISLHPVFMPCLAFALASLLIHEEDSERADYYYKLFRDSESAIVNSFSRASHSSVYDVYS
jgi:hypothetical protein